MGFVIPASKPKDTRGRKKMKDEDKTTMVSFRAQQWLIDFLRGHDQSQAVLIHRAVKNYFDLEIDP